MARMANSKATKVAPFANGDLTRQVSFRLSVKVSMVFCAWCDGSDWLFETYRISVGARPPVNPLQPCVRHVLTTQSKIPVYAL